MKFHGNFIGSEIYDGVTCGSGDMVKEYDINVLTQPLDWYYKNKIIKYNYNQFGHRCKNLADVNLHNYILFTGCSHTEGVGLELEKSYPYVTSGLSGYDYYNLGLGSSGIDVLLFNLIAWFSTVDRLPRAVVIQWPDISRFSTIAPNADTIVPNGTWSSDKQINDYIVADYDCNASDTKALLAKKLIELVIKCPIYYVTLKGQKLPGGTSGIPFIKVDVARDLAHFGIKSNETLATNLATIIKTI